jgi:methylglyoxal reductase
MAQYQQMGPLDADQEKYSMLDREIESDQLLYSREKGIAVLAYSPLALGLLTGQVRTDRQFAPGDQRVSHPRFKPESLQRVNALLEDLKPLAADFELSLAQFALAWTLAQPGLTHVLVGARHAQQALENVKAGSIALRDQTVSEARAILRQHGI